MRTDAMAKINTAPAATSLAAPAILWCSGETISTISSMAVLNISAEITPPMATITIIHSVRVIWKKKPA